VEKDAVIAGGNKEETGAVKTPVSLFEAPVLMSSLKRPIIAKKVVYNVLCKFPLCGKIGTR